MEEVITVAIVELTKAGQVSHLINEMVKKDQNFNQQFSTQTDALTTILSGKCLLVQL